jgi:type I restriction enzyme R subunit
MIVIDESHRSIYNTYREILDYFNAIQLGLTATPRDIVDHNTFALFQCDDGLPTFAYSYEEAIDHVPPYLCDFRVLKIKTKFQDEGISKRTVSLEDQKHLILEGKEIEDINFEGSDLEKKVTNHATNALIVKEFMEESIKDPNGVLPGKTIFFCISMNHARRIEAIFDSLYPEYKGELAKVMVSDDPRVYGKGGLLDQFTRNDMPRVAISVDMLDTGIDIREIVNLVFAKPVFSYTKFWQMIGRRTRLLESNKIKPWCPEKDVFQIIDCWDNFEYFKLTPKGKEPKSQIPLPVRFAGVRIDKIEAALALGHPSVAETEIAALRAQIAAFPARSVTIMEAKEQLAQCQVEAFWKPLTAERIALLRHAVQPLFRVVSQADFKAMRFEKEILEASLAHLKDEKEKYAALTENLVVQISELPLSVNIVAQEAGLIQKAQTNHYWATMTDQSFDHLATHLDKATLRWSHFKQMKAEDMLPHVQQKVFPFIKDLNGEGTAFTRHMATAVFLIPSPNLLYGAIAVIDEMFLEIERESREEGHLFQDIQGDVYEMLLNEISSAGKNGQFRTPRHIIKLISEVVNPQFGHNICDPACGTAGFLLDA